MEFEQKLKEYINKQSWSEGPDDKHETGRMSSDEYFMKMAHLVKERATCLRRKVGAVIVKDKHILTTGYNGNPKGLKHCAEIGCLRTKLEVPSGERHELCTGVHAEQNAIIQAALFGVSIDGSIMYCTTTPCNLCAKMIINSGIREIILDSDYPDELAMKMLRDSKVKVRKFEK